MREFWDRRAREDPYFFVDNRRAYGDPEPGSFFDDGEADLERLLSLVGVRIRPEDVVLDIGCGLGRLTRALAARAAFVYGLDISPEMIERARGLALENAEWIVGDGSTLRPLADASVDVCVSHVVFQHIPDPCVTLSYIREMGRVLKPGGRAAFQVSNDPAAHRSRRRGLWRALRRLAGRAPHGEAEAAWLGSAVDLSDLRAVAEQAGMEVARMFGEGKQFCLIGAFKPVSSPPRGSSRTRAG